MIKRAALIVLVLSVAAAGVDAAEEARPIMKDFIGINGHFHFKPELYRQVCRLARNYHNMDWDVKRPGDKPTFPVCVNKVNWEDHVYGKWVKGGFEVDICAQFGAFGRGRDGFKELWKGNEAWAGTYGYEMATAFGPSGQRKLCTSIEIDNEPGKEFDDELYRRIFVAMARGIRKADPQIKIVTCAVHAREADTYIKSLQETFGSEQMQRLYDIINLHVYAIKPKKEGQSPWARSYPEDASLDYLKVVDEAIAWRNEHAPQKAIWITEFGWDACTDAAMKNKSGWFLKLNWDDVTDLQQAQYLVRSLLCFAGRDIERAYIYYYDDKDEPSVHASSGLTRNFQPKTAFWAVKHLYETLGEYRFNRVIKKAKDEVYIYEFVHGTDEGLLAWVAWSPTGHGREKQMSIRGLPCEPSKIDRMAVNDLPATNVTWKRSNDGDIQLNISESPAYIMMRK